jgi:hypothetical protein
MARYCSWACAGIDASPWHSWSAVRRLGGRRRTVDERARGAFGVVGISALTFGVITHSADSGTVLAGGGGSFLIGFGLAGMVTGVGSVSTKRTVAAVLAFELGGILGASAAVSARLFVHWSSLNGAMLGAIVGLGAVGVFMSWLGNRSVRRRLGAA